MGPTEVTYWIRRARWGQGIATAALAELVSVVEERPLWARVASDNVGSASVLERNGFTRVGTEAGFARARGTEIEETIYRLGA
ncbi:MAG: GNAT family N-acetyltransferase [Marmoricola sp.]